MSEVEFLPKWYTRKRTRSRIVCIGIASIVLAIFAVARLQWG